jgi:hypothetical protein
VANQLVLALSEWGHVLDLEVSGPHPVGLPHQVAGPLGRVPVAALRAPRLAVTPLPVLFRAGAHAQPQAGLRERRRQRVQDAAAGATGEGFAASALTVTALRREHARREQVSTAEGARGAVLGPTHQRSVAQHSSQGPLRGVGRKHVALRIRAGAGCGGRAVTPGAGPGGGQVDAAGVGPHGLLPSLCLCCRQRLCHVGAACAMALRRCGSPRRVGPPRAKCHCHICPRLQ